LTAARRAKYLKRGDKTMKRATTEVLYFETGRDNPVTLRVQPGEEFEVQTQLNRGPWLDDHPDGAALRAKLYDQRAAEPPAALKNSSVPWYLSQGLPSGNPSSGCIYVRSPTSPKSPKSFCRRCERYASSQLRLALARVTGVITGLQNIVDSDVAQSVSDIYVKVELSWSGEPVIANHGLFIHQRHRTLNPTGRQGIKFHPGLDRQLLQTINVGRFRNQHPSGLISDGGRTLAKLTARWR
jgi:hypothetical protein